MIAQMTNIPLSHAHIDGLFARTIGNAYIKTNMNQIAEVNEAQIVAVGCSSRNDLIGLTAYDFYELHSARSVVATDNKIMITKQADILIESAHILKNNLFKNYLSYKAPLLSANGKVIGIYGLSYRLDSVLNNNDILDEISLVVGTYGIAYIKKLLTPYQQTNYKLSNRQLSCLQLLAKGMTAKQIAKKLTLSQRTVEHYLEAIKIKLKCESRFELIEMANHIGLL